MADVVTTVGKAHIVDLIDGSSSLNPKFIGWGTGAGTAAAGDTDLFTTATEARVTGVESQPAADKYRAAQQMVADAGKTITNVGTFTSAGSGSPPTGGTLVIHGNFTGVVLALGDKIDFTVDLQIT